jgi:hypothetical protein
MDGLFIRACLEDRCVHCLARATGFDAASPCGETLPSGTLDGRPACGGALWSAAAPPAAGRFLYMHFVSL